MESNEHYYFPSHFNGLNNMNKIVLALRVMCIKAGFYLVHRSTKTKKQLAADHNAYITLCCQHSLMYYTAKKEYIRSTFTKLCTDPDKRCRFSINIALCKHSDKWFLKNKRNSKSKQFTLHTGHIRLLPEHISCSINMLNEEDHQLMRECNQVTINAAKITQLISLRNKYGTNTIWTRDQIYYVQKRTDPLSGLNCNASSATRLIEFCQLDPDINYLYMTYDRSNKLIMLTGKPFYRIKTNNDNINIL